MFGCAILWFIINHNAYFRLLPVFWHSYFTRCVATCLRCGGIFKYEFVANLLVSLPVKEFRKSVNIWGSYGQEFSVLFFWDTVYIPGGPKKRPELSHGVMQHSRWNESAEKHVCNEQTSSNMSTNFHLKRFHISRGTSEIKQCLQAVRHLCCWLYAGYTRTSQ